MNKFRQHSLWSREIDKLKQRLDKVEKDLEVHLYGEKEEERKKKEALKENVFPFDR